MNRALLSLMAPLCFAACNQPTTSTTTAPTATETAAAAPLKEGDAAPDVELKLQNGKSVRLSSLKGTTVALYFYPKDETQGCTIEAQSLRDRFDELKSAGITVFGVSTQDATSHQHFIEKEKLPFDLVVDVDGSIAKAYQVPMKSGFSARQTFLIDAQGRLKKIWRDVDPTKNTDAILAAAK